MTTDGVEEYKATVNASLVTALVGPRPPLLHEVAQDDDAMARRLRVRPGMTGLWQVSGRSDLTMLARTFGAVFSSRGAC